MLLPLAVRAELLAVPFPQALDVPDPGVRRQRLQPAPSADCDGVAGCENVRPATALERNPLRWWGTPAGGESLRAGIVHPCGERNRLQLAKTLAGGGNVLMLDEPTPNDLDVATLRALEEAIVSWNGVVLCISHDRWFLNKICTHILAYEGDSAVTFFEGSYAEYAEYRKEALGGAEPKAIKFKPMPTPA